MIDYTPGKPDFNILRLGHIEYLVSDLARARDFYVDVVGLFETESDADHVYLRAIEDREHHSVVLTRSPSPGIGHFSFRVSCAEDLDRLAHKFAGLGLPMRWLAAGEERGQGRAARAGSVRLPGRVLRAHGTGALAAAAIPSAPPRLPHPARSPERADARRAGRLRLVHARAGLLLL